MQRTRLSTKGQVILPKGIRASRAWGPGTEFTVEEVADGVLLRPAESFPHAELDDVAGSLRVSRGRRTDSRMAASIAEEVKRRHGRGRY